MEKIKFAGADGDSIDFYVIEKTTLGGVDYMLVTETEDGDSDAYVLKDASETEDGDSDAYVLKDVSAASDEEGVYEIVDDETELNAVGQVFASLLDDVDIQ